MPYHHSQQQVSEAAFRGARPLEAPGVSSQTRATRPLSPDLTDGYAIGETDFECWNTLWKARPSDSEVDPEEWVIFLDRIQEHFRRNYENFPDEFYFWGDFSGDRTLDLKVAKPAVLTARLLSDLQKYLQMNGQRMWRIRIPIYFEANDPLRVIVVYPHAIDIPPLREPGGCLRPPPAIGRGSRRKCGRQLRIPAGGLCYNWGQQRGDRGISKVA